MSSTESKYIVSSLSVRSSLKGHPISDFPETPEEKAQDRFKQYGAVFAALATVVSSLFRFLWRTMSSLFFKATFTASLFIGCISVVFSLMRDAILGRILRLFVAATVLATCTGTLAGVNAVLWYALATRIPDPKRNFFMRWIFQPWIAIGLSLLLLLASVLCCIAGLYYTIQKIDHHMRTAFLTTYIVVTGVGMVATSTLLFSCAANVLGHFGNCTRASASAGAGGGAGYANPFFLDLHELDEGENEAGSKKPSG
jgi:ABC-type multidrug transport system permease subunit